MRQEKAKNYYLSGVTGSNLVTLYILYIFRRFFKWAIVFLRDFVYNIFGDKNDY